jgi:hypothetical protein
VGALAGTAGAFTPALLGAFGMATGAQILRAETYQRSGIGAEIVRFSSSSKQLLVSNQVTLAWRDNMHHLLFHRDPRRLRAVFCQCGPITPIPNPSFTC